MLVERPLKPLADGCGRTETFSGVSDTPAERERFAGLIPMRRMLDHGDIANTAVWLSSDEANFISGVCLPVDGGFACV